MTEKHYLVEIRLQKWVAGENRTIAYEEVLANDEFSACCGAYDQFVKRTKFEPIMRRKWEKLNFKYSEICASDSVCIDV